MKFIQKILPWCFLALFVTEMVVVLLPKRDGEMHTREFGRLPVLLNGRIQPFDSVARNALLQIRSTGDLPLELVPGWKFWYHPPKLRSTEWLLEVMFKPEVADTRSIFLIHHPDLISELNLGDQGIEKSGLRYYTYNELESSLAEIGSQGSKAAAMEAAQRTPYQKQVLKLANAVFLYQKLKNSIQPEGTADFGAFITNFQEALAPGIAAFQAQQSGQPADTAALETLARSVRALDSVSAMAYPLVIPPANPSQNPTAWQNMGENLLGAIHSGEIHPAAKLYATMGKAYRDGDAGAFNAAVANYKEWLGADFERQLAKGRAEYYYNQVKAFLHATIIYIFAFVLAAGALLSFGTSVAVSETLRRSAFFLIVLAFIVHTFGLIFRMVLEGRPPVTNLYSSAVFIGWGACVLGLVLERVYRNGLGSSVAGLAGFVTLLIAHNLALGGDTMEMMRAVLDTNFWLATHVVVVTLGYASTFVAGTLAMAYVILGVFTPTLTTPMSRPAAIAAGSIAATMVKTRGSIARTAREVTAAAEKGELGKALTRMVFAIICFAALFSFTGTVLGGIWADQSWGRFWGWDPKENGALLIVLWNVLILHARLGKLIQERGLMNLAIFGNVVTAWSWFGTNMLGIGLHSYGFMDSAFRWLMLFNMSQVALIVLGCLPLQLWRSFRTESDKSGGNGKQRSPVPA